MPKKTKEKAVTAVNSQGGASFLYRNIIPFANPNQVYSANAWRAICRNQPVIMNCISTIKMRIQSLPYDIRARDVEKSDELKGEIEYHKQLLNESQLGQGFLNYLDLLLDDYLVTPFGGATATPRYSDGTLYKIYAVDANTLYPYNDETWYVIQQVQSLGNTNPIFFDENELVRMYQNPRPELERYGWGIAPPERVYLALEMLNRGDRYYSNLLLDTPEAGILDLMDMSKDSAERWLESFRNLFSGIDGFKIPVLYEHTSKAAWIPFSRPPSDIMYDTVTFKYAQIICAAFGLTTGDIGLKSNTGGSLGSEIRDQVHSKSTGYASVKKHIEEHLNKFIDPRLEFWFIDVDSELLTAKGRARSANAVAMRNLIESGTLTPEEARQQLKADGLITIPLPEKVKPEDFDIIKDISGLTDQIDLQKQQLELDKQQAAKNTSGSSKGNLDRKGGQAGFSLNKRRNVRGAKLEQVQGKDPVPASSGGMGEIKSLLEQDYINLEKLLRSGFDDILHKADKERLSKLIKLSVSKYQETSKLLVEGEDHVEKSIKNISKDYLNSKDRWWRLELDEAELAETLTGYYELGLANAASEIQQALYDDDLVNTNEVDLIFLVKNQSLLNKYDRKSQSLIDLINSGTLYYLTSLSLMSVANTYGQENYYDLVNQSDFVLDETNLDKSAVKLKELLHEITNERVNNIAYIEAHRSFNEGQLQQYRKVGIEKKYLVHLAEDIPCEVCQSALNLNEVDLDYEYQTKFGSETTSVVPLHPSDHCELRFSTENLEKLDTNYYTGE